MKKLESLITSADNQRPDPSRRWFLQTSALAGAGFLIGCSEEPAAPTGAETAAPAMPAEPVDAAFNAFLRISSDNTVTVVVKHLDKGQGVTTGLPTIVAEELDAAWDQMRFEFAPANAALYNNTLMGPVQVTGGSSSVSNSWMQLRQAAAGARAMLVQAAAQTWGVAASAVQVSGGMVTSGQNSASFGELAAAAAELTPPEQPELKSPDQFKLIGTRLPRLDSNAKTDGTAQFTIDIDRPGMLMAAIAHPPRFGATVRSVDDAAARAMAGVEDVVQTPRGVAVVADSFWTAVKARDALTIDWDFSASENRGSEELRSYLKELVAGEPGGIARNDGDVEVALGSAARVIEADFEFPFLAHATMEPMNCVVELSETGCEIWTGSQIQTLDQGAVAALTGLAPEKININTVYAGGSFGRRADPDSSFVVEAVMIAQAINGRAPVKLQWTRENDMRAGRYRPISQHRLRAGLNEQGDIVAWHHSMAIQSFLAGTPFAMMLQDGVDATAVEGARGLPYAIPNLKVDQTLAEIGVPGLWWRSVGHTHNGYVTEVFFDELAQAAGKDPVELRRSLLASQPRHLAVLELAAEKAEWGAPVADGKGRGFALHESFGSVVAQVVDVSIGDNGVFSVDRVVCAVDCGIAVNPDVVAAQMEGGIGYGLSAALAEAVTLVDGEVQEGNFDRYLPLRISQMPEVEVHIVPSEADPTGVGEPGLPPLAPALANALAQASGKWIRKLPIGRQLQA